ncbi:MAG: GGDEF domain-containing protein [Aquabacterium sp.]
MRQRFYWALGSALISFVAYAGWVSGFTHEQGLFAQSNLRLMSVSFVFVLLANYFFEHSERRTWLLRKVEARQRQALLSSSMRFQQLCNQDALTGLANRRAFDAHMERAWAHAVDHRSELALLVIDVDYFKAFNDSKGHPAGDDCLVRLSGVLSAIGARHEGLVARLGGEEFGIVLPGRSAATAEALAIEICREVERAAIAHDGLTEVPWVTVSVGGAQASTEADTGPAMLLERADGALYRAKEQGRNQACFDARLPAADASLVQRRWRDRQERRAAQAGEAADIQLSFPSPDPVKEEALQQTLAAKFRRLRFPREQEAAFRETLSEQRRRELVWLYILGLVIFNVYILVNRPVFPDIGGDVLMVQMGVTGGLFALCVLAYVTPLTLGWREGLFGVGTSVIALTCAWVLSQSRLTSTLNFAAALALIPMFVAVGARQSFRATCMPAVMTCVSAAWLLSPQDAIAKAGVRRHRVHHRDGNTVFSLMLAYTLEYGQRREWLLSKIDDLQRQALVSAAARLQLLSVGGPAARASATAASSKKTSRASGMTACRTAARWRC